MSILRSVLFLRGNFTVDVTKTTIFANATSAGVRLTHFDDPSDDLWFTDTPLFG